MENSIVKLDAKAYGLEENKAKEIESVFIPMIDKMKTLEVEYNELKTKEVNDEVCKQAKALRQKYVKVRTGTAAIHKEVKAFYLSGSRFVDAWKNTQLYASQGIEKNLEQIEKHFEVLEKEKKQKLEDERRTELSKYQELDIALKLSDMSDEVWKMFLSGAIKYHEDKIEAEKKAEILRQEQLKKKAEEKEKQRLEQERIIKENEKLKYEAEEKEKSRQVEKKEQQEKLDAEKKERERLETELKAKLKAEQDRREAEHKEMLDRERKEIESIQAKLAAKEKAEQDRLEVIKKEQEAKEAEEKRIKESKRYVEYKDYLHKSKESNNELLSELELVMSEEAEAKFSYSNYEVELDMLLDTETGKTKIIKVNGRKLMEEI